MKSGLERGLSQHGYLFQHQVVAEIERLAEDSPSQSRWRVVAIEVPVLAGSKSTRIDVLIQDDSEPGRLRFLIGECKRVNPAYGAWCFARAPRWFPEWAGRQLISESLVRYSDDDRVVTAGIGGTRTDRAYSIGFAVKTKAQGDTNPVSADQDALEAACTQVCRGLNGFVSQLLADERYRAHIADRHAVQLLPVVFTTATLYATDADLLSLERTAGEPRLESDPASPEWLLYQYPQSPEVKHSLARGSLSHDSLTGLIARDFTRSVVIVTFAGIRGFLEEGWKGETDGN